MSIWTTTYDPAGNPVSIADTGAQAGAGDVQYFTYDHHRRLIDAWSQTSTPCAAGVASATIGGPAPYGAHLQLRRCRQPYDPGGSCHGVDYNVQLPSRRGGWPAQSVRSLHFWHSASDVMT